VDIAPSKVRCGVKPRTLCVAAGVRGTSAGCAECGPPDQVAPRVCCGDLGARRPRRRLGGIPRGTSGRATQIISAVPDRRFPLHCESGSPGAAREWRDFSLGRPFYPIIKVNGGGRDPEAFLREAAPGSLRSRQDSALSKPYLFYSPGRSVSWFATRLTVMRGLTRAGREGHRGR
jgi:hypothetical protein